MSELRKYTPEKAESFQIARPLTTEQEYGPWRTRRPEEDVPQAHILTIQGIEYIPASVYGHDGNGSSNKSGVVETSRNGKTDGLTNGIKESAPWRSPQNYKPRTKSSVPWRGPGRYSGRNL